MIYITGDTHKTGKAYDTTVGTIHYSNSGTHIVPEKPINWR